MTYGNWSRAVPILAGAGMVLMALAGSSIAEEQITFTDLDSLVRAKPLPPGPTADIIATRHVDASDLQVVVARKIDLHIHEDTQHIVYVARGTGTFYFKGKSRPVKVGDIITIPKKLVHGFEADAGSEPLVLLVAETPS